MVGTDGDVTDLNVTAGPASPGRLFSLKKTNTQVLLFTSTFVLVAALLREFDIWNLLLALVTYFLAAIGLLQVLLTLGFVLYYFASGRARTDWRKRTGPGQAFRHLRLDGVALVLCGVAMVALGNRGWIPTLKHAPSAKLASYNVEKRAEFESAVKAVRASGDKSEIEHQLKKLGLCGTFQNHPEKNLVLLNLYEDPIWAGAGYFKGYAYSETDLQPQVKDIDEGVKYSTFSYQKLDGNWYLYYFYY